MHEGQLSEAITRPNNRMSESSETTSGDGRVNWRDAHRDIEETEIHKSVQVGNTVVGAEVAAR